MVFQSIASKYNDHTTTELVRSEKGKDGSAMLIHLSEEVLLRLDGGIN